MGSLPLQNSVDVLVRKFVSVASGIASKYVIPGNDSSPAPNVPYATVLEIIKLGSGVDSEVAKEGPDPEIQKTLEHQGRRVITYSVQFFKPGAADFIEGLLSFAATSPGQIWLAENELTWGVAGDIINLDAIMGTFFEERRQVDITFRYQSRRAVDINTIGSVDIDAALSKSADLTETLGVTDAED